MLHLLKYDGQYFCIEVAEVANTDESGRLVYVSWCSDSFRELKDAPSKACMHFVSGPPLGKHAEALRHAQDWVTNNWDGQRTRRTPMPTDQTNVIYSVSLFKGEEFAEFTFDEFLDAKTFAKAAERITDITKVGIRNNESPQYLTVWENPK